MDTSKERVYRVSLQESLQQQFFVESRQLPLAERVDVFIHQISDSIILHFKACSWVIVAGGVKSSVKSYIYCFGESSASTVILLEVGVSLSGEFSNGSVDRTTFDIKVTARSLTPQRCSLFIDFDLLQLNRLFKLAR